MLSTSALWILLPLLGACAPGASALSVEQDPEVATVLRVSWSTEAPGSSWVEFGLDGEASQSTPVSATTAVDHAHTLLGLPPYEDLWIRAITETEGERHVVEGRAATGALPAVLPELAVTVYEPALASPEPYAVGTMLGEDVGAAGVYALDREGRCLWYHQDPEGSIPLELVSTAGGVVYNRFGDDPEVDESVVRRASYDGVLDEVVPTAAGHHAFTRFPDGSLAWLAIDVRAWWSEDAQAEISVVGDAVVLRSPDGVERTIFSTWDWVEPEPSSLWDDAFYPQGADWSHGNGLHYDEDRDLLVLSLRNLNTVLELALDEDRTDAWPVRQLGLEGGARFVSDDRLYQASSDEAFRMQHDPTFTAAGTLLLTTVLDARTQVAEYSLDDDGHKLRLGRTHGRDEELLSSAMGMARELANGNWLVSFGTSGLVQEVTPSGVIAWELRASAGCALGDVQLFDGFYAL